MKRGVKRVRLWALIALVLAVGTVGYRGLLTLLYPLRYEDFVGTYAEAYDVPPSLVYAVIKCESGFRAQARSEADAKGLMQIRDDTFDWVKSKMPKAEAENANVWDPETNIKFGTFLLSLHRTEFGNDEAALAAYHAGRGRVKQWLADKQYSADGETLTRIPYDDTSAYVRKVRFAQKMYRDLYGLE